MSLPEIFQNSDTLADQHPATPPCSSDVQSPGISGLASTVSQPTQLAEMNDSEPHNLELWLDWPQTKKRESETSAQEEVQGARENVAVIILSLFDEDEWDDKWNAAISQASDPDLSCSASSDGGFSDTSTGEASSETSSDGDSNEASEQYIDIDLLDGYEYSRPDLADNTIHHTGL